MPEYDTNPPTSGDHDPQQQADGAYTEAEEVHTLHSLEHGRIDIQYSPDLPEKDQLALKGVFDEDPDGMLFFPDPDMPYVVAATAWQQLLGCKTYEGAGDARRDPRLPRHLPRLRPRAAADPRRGVAAGGNPGKAPANLRFWWRGGVSDALERIHPPRGVLRGSWDRSE